MEDINKLIESMNEQQREYFDSLPFEGKLMFLVRMSVGELWAKVQPGGPSFTTLRQLSDKLDEAELFLGKLCNIMAAEAQMREDAVAEAAKSGTIIDGGSDMAPTPPTESVE